MYNCNDEIPKQRKKKESSVSKSKNKAKHRHEYKDCLFIEEDYVHKGAYCTICGKVKQFDFFDGAEKTTGGWLMLTGEELLEKYSDIEQIKVDKYFLTKYIDLQSMEEDV